MDCSVRGAGAAATAATHVEEAAPSEQRLRRVHLGDLAVAHDDDDVEAQNRAKTMAEQVSGIESPLRTRC